MKIFLPKSHLFLEDDLPLFEYNQIFSCGSIWLKKGMQRKIATFDLYVRDLPKCRNFFVFGGLEEVVCGIQKWHYSDEHVQFLLDNKVITKEFGEYLKEFKFSGNIWAMPEGTVFFPGEPVIRITAPIIEANLFTMFLINAITSNTIFLTKATRCVIAAAPQNCNGIYGVRAQSFESSLKSARNSYIAGTTAIACPTFFRKYQLPMPPALTIGYHAFIKSFDTELEAMRAIAETFPKGMIVMIDTYDIEQGIKNAITVAKELKAKGKSLKGIMIDSGDLFEIAVLTRKMLDKAGLKDVKITVASNLDEYAIAKLKKKGIPADAFLVVTEGVTVSDAPNLEIVYKLAQLQDGKKTVYTAKFSPQKLSYPGVKQVYRVGTDEKQKDIIGLETEKLGKPLLVEIARNGKFVYELPALDKIKAHLKNQLKELPPKLLDIEKQHAYPVETSQGLKALLEIVRKKHVKQ